MNLKGEDMNHKGEPLNDTGGDIYYSGGTRVIIRRIFMTNNDIFDVKISLSNHIKSLIGL